jgi:hypothetical protein
LGKFEKSMQQSQTHCSDRSRRCGTESVSAEVPSDEVDEPVSTLVLGRGENEEAFRDVFLATTESQAQKVREASGNCTDRRSQELGLSD